MKYKILLSPTEYEQEIKKSKFITYLAHTDSLEQAKDFWQTIKKQHPNARHHCWAAVTGAPNNSMLYGFSDDGEPSGTAGKPMLSCLVGSGIGEISAVIVRYFGGILLGTGGLVKAYSTSIQQAVKLAPTIEKIPQISCSLLCDYTQLDLIINILNSNTATILNQDFQQQVHLLFSINPDNFDKLQTIIMNQTSGKVIIAKQ